MHVIFSYFSDEVESSNFLLIMARKAKGTSQNLKERLNKRSDTNHLKILTTSVRNLIRFKKSIAMHSKIDGRRRRKKRSGWRK